MGLDQPISVALIGAGNRSQKVYKPLINEIKPWVNLVAVCDPVRENADSLAEALGVPAFYDIKELVESRPMEAAFVVTPVPSHHSIAIYLMSNGINVNVETSMATLLVQAQQMVDTARDNDVILRIGENFFRKPFDRLIRLINQDGFIGPIKRLTCWHDHTGYHNNSRWISFFQSYPIAAQSITHTMSTHEHYQMPHRLYDSETYKAHFYWFPNNELVIDHAGNIKSMLGRYPRPGYTELAGARGSIVQQAGQKNSAKQPYQGWEGLGEVRYCTDESLQQHGKSGVADQIFPIVHSSDSHDWLSSHVDLPTGRVEYVNPHRPGKSAYHHGNYYSAAVMDHIVDFAETIRCVKKSEYTDQDALMAMMMEVATRESAMKNGERLSLPLKGELESDVLMRTKQRQEYGVDPLDIEGMLSIKFPRP